MEGTISNYKVITMMDHSKYNVDSDGQFQTELNEGNFRALLSFWVESGDKILEAHKKSVSRTATYMYISKITQNKIISCIGQHTVQALSFSVCWLMKPQMLDIRLKSNDTSCLAV